jgi:predicted ATPase
VQAVLQFLRAECADHPLLIILEDLQWSDAATVRLIGRALRELAGQPLFVLGIARPEVRKRFPRLWNEHRFLELHLDRLNEASSATLAREVLGQEVPMATIRRITDQAGSNPQHLEELIRWVDEGRENEPPGTLIAMLQAHLLTLPVEERRLLRAASIFGQSFSLPGLLFLLAADATPQEVERWLRSLVEQEIIVRDRRYTPEQQSAFRFRSTLMQEAAYSLLSPADRSAGHRLARTFLAAAGEDSCWLLATHAERGGELSRAGVLYREAAEQLAQEDNFARALEACRCALRCATGADERQAALAVELHVQSLRALTSSLPKP